MKLRCAIQVSEVAACALAVLMAAGPARADVNEAIREFQMPQVEEPQIPARAVDVTEFGAVPDGTTLNTEAIAIGIDALVAQGGGRLVFPPGIWLTGPIELKSNVELHLEQGALVQFTRQFDQYPFHAVRMKDDIRMAVTAPIWAHGAQNIAITGQGVIDGGGDAWRPVKRFKMTTRQWQALLASGGVVDRETDIWWPTQEAFDAATGKIEIPQGSTNPQDWEPLRVFMRPQLVKLVSCRRILLEGVTFQNSPAWNLNPTLCEDLTVRNVVVRNPWYSQNGDGLDLESCRDTIVTGSRFDVGDDAICLKSGRDAEGRRMAAPTENVLIQDCVVYHGHGGFVIGSEMSGGVHNIRVDNCVFMGTDVGLRFKSTRGRGGVVERIYISNVTMTDIPGEAILFDLYYEGQAPLDGNGNIGDSRRPAEPVSEATPQFKDVYMKHVVCRGARRAMLLQGLPEMPLSNIQLEDVSVSSDQGAVAMDTDNISLTNVEILVRQEPVLQMSGSRNMVIDSLRYPASATVVVSLHGPDNGNIVLRNTDLTAADEDFQFVGGATSEAIDAQ